MPSSRTVAVIGASSDRRKYGNKAVRAYRAAGWKVFPVHPTETVVEELPVFRNLAAVPEPLEAVSMYVPAAVGAGLLPAIAAVHPKEVWVNPGAESPALRAEARRLELPVIYGCSILSLGHSPAEFPDA